MTLPKRVDVAIVGAGPAGMFCAHRLSSSNPSLSIAILDKGKPVAERDPLYARGDLISGAGGAGLFSDGKLTLTLRAGGKLGNLINEEKAGVYIRYVEDILLSCDGTSVAKGLIESPSKIFLGQIERLELRYKHLPVRHFGSSRLRAIIANFFETLGQNPRVYFGFRTQVDDIITGKIFAIKYKDASGRLGVLNAARVVLAVGKEGSPWLGEVLAPHGIVAAKNRTFFGVRIQTNLAHGLDFCFDPKISAHFSDGTKIKTHCFCRRGQVLSLSYWGLPLAGSHSPLTEEESNPARDVYSVFGILLGDSPEQAFTAQMAFGLMKQIGAFARGGLLVQRFADFARNRATSWSDLRANGIRANAAAFAPGNIAALKLPLDFNRKLLQFAERLITIDQTWITDDSLLFAPAIEWWMPKIETNSRLETSIRDLYVAGDGAGFSQGIMYAATTGLIVADSILES